VLTKLVLLLGLLGALWLARFVIDRRTRRRMVAIVSAGLEFVPTRAEDVFGLDCDQLDDLSRELRAEGFVHQLDYQVRRGAEPTPRGFARLFLHPAERCFAEIMLAGAVAPDRPMYVAINSHLESDWSLGTSNIPASPADLFMRLPRTLRMRYPDDSVARLCARHLERRGQILGDLGLRVMDDVSTDFYFAKVRAAMDKQKANMQKASPLRDLPAAKQAAVPREQEWLGDYEAEAERHRGKAGGGMR
jgi:hypothetical protein